MCEAYLAKGRRDVFFIRQVPRDKGHVVETLHNVERINHIASSNESVDDLTTKSTTATNNEIDTL
jgi:hypothetical protein